MRSRNALVWTSPTGGCHVVGYDAGFAETARETLGRRVTIRDLRHTCASHLLAAGAYLFAVRDVLGHVHAETTARYLHWIDPGESTEAIFHRLHPRA